MPNTCENPGDVNQEGVPSAGGVIYDKPSNNDDNLNPADSDSEDRVLDGAEASEATSCDATELDRTLALEFLRACGISEAEIPALSALLKSGCTLTFHPSPDLLTLASDLKTPSQISSSPATGSSRNAARMETQMGLRGYGSEPHNDERRSVGLSYCACESAKSRPIQLLRHRLYPATTTDPRSATTFGALKFFHIMSFESKGSHEEFYHTIRRLTGNVNVEAARDRYHEFITMVSQWRNLKMLKRAGRAHDEGGIDGTGAGDCALRCPACPQAGVNLPRDWQFVSSPDKKLKRRKVSSDERDPGLNNGWAFFVEEKGYKKWLAANWNEKQDIKLGPMVQRSTCVAHDAVNKPDKEARGLAASGAVAVVCTRHEFKIPNGVGDLQKGERYINVDYVLFSGLRMMTVWDLVISYDIICQWYKNLSLRASLLPKHIQPGALSSLTLLIPKFHLPAHIDFCNRTFSYNLTPGVGRSDGEAPERGWARINAVAKSTAEMGPGRRRDTLDDHFNDGNWKKTCLMGISLLEKMVKAVAGKAKHGRLFREFKESIPAAFIARWTKEVEAWEVDPINCKNPFEVTVKAYTRLIFALGITEKEIRLRLAHEAEEEDGVNTTGKRELEGTGSVHPSLFVAQGTQLEDDQHRLRQAVSQLSNHPTSKQLSILAERSNALRRRIIAWFEIQKVYMPGADIIRQRAVLDTTKASGSPSLEVYDITLLLPSALPLSESKASLRAFEAELRKGQAYDALADVRRYLRLRSYLLKKKDMYARGVSANTRANVAIKRAQAGVDWAAAKYRRARKLLMELSPVSDAADGDLSQWRADLLPLEEGDVRGLSEGMFGESEGTRSLSWIWFSSTLNATSASRDNIETDVQLQEALRIEFLKTRARALRWDEEVELLEEEKRRTMQFFSWKASWWLSRPLSSIGGEGEDYLEGFRAYASSQASVYGDLWRGCAEKWSTVSKVTSVGLKDSEIDPDLRLAEDDELDDDDVLDMVDDYV
ncbi:hypothetical protein DFP72DRAFT_859845 [Ephemerocybe angulata]|uniref:CxC2-like cysteine cluster KDZ transposase-associated domain-containing protein n=1 Tax=Ephemerocybe angulata TaxID=980116 RepID=A0A8H6H9E5_9AGAR|nr:hypothetical protein DFP72DRAFT_859845 [Tulosesus angulatus]